MFALGGLIYCLHVLLCSAWHVQELAMSQCMFKSHSLLGMNDICIVVHHLSIYEHLALFYFCGHCTAGCCLGLSEYYIHFGVELLCSVLMMFNLWNPQTAQQLHHCVPSGTA